jgi:hypothetical protein
MNKYKNRKLCKNIYRSSNGEYICTLKDNYMESVEYCDYEISEMKKCSGYEGYTPKVIIDAKLMDHSGKFEISRETISAIMVIASIILPALTLILIGICIGYKLWY